MSARKVLFVCTGNICRSAMAEQLLRQLAADRKLDLETRSAGTHAQDYYEVPAVVHRLLGKEGLPPFVHKARLVTREALRWADVVLVMTQDHYDHLVELYPEFTAKTRLLRAEAGFGEEDVEDPMGRSDEVFTHCMNVLQESLQAWLARA